MTVRLLSRNKRAVTYEATFWEGPIEAGQVGRRVKRVCRDWIVDRLEHDSDGKPIVIGRRLANTARNCSYYPALEKALRIKWGKDQR